MPSYQLTFRLPQVVDGAMPPHSSETEVLTTTARVRGFLRKLSQGGVMSKPKWQDGRCACMHMLLSLLLLLPLLLLLSLPCFTRRLLFAKQVR